MIEGLSHITFIVSDLDRMEEVLSTVLDARKIYDSGEETFSIAQERFYDIAGLWIAIMEGDRLASRTYNHVAFKISDNEYEERLRRIMALELDVQESRSRIEGEGRSIYFHDHDNHLFELHTGTLEERIARYAI